jgi:hypothetical protein
MNNPEYILTDEMKVIAAAVQQALSLSVLNYQYGYIEELNQTLKQWEQSRQYSELKFPLIWFAEPFDTTRGTVGIYGIAEVNIFIINTTTKNWKAEERMENNYKPFLYPIYRELLNQFTKTAVFSHITVEDIPHRVTKGYYWGEDQKSVLNDAVDCLKIGSLKLRVQNNNNCTPISI